MTEFNFKTENGTNRALVCYCATSNGFEVNNVVNGVFESQNINVEPFIDGGGETTWTTSNVVVFNWEEAISTLNIGLEFADKIKRLKVGGNFEHVTIGLFFYGQPAPTPESEPISDNDETVIDEEPEPQPSLTELVCDALRDTFGGTFGASSFAISNTITEFTLEVK